MISRTSRELIRTCAFAVLLPGLMNCAESMGEKPARSVAETIQALRGVCTAAMTEEESAPFEKELRLHELAAVDSLISLATGSDPTGCRVIGVLVLADLAPQHASLIPKLVRELVPLADDKDLQQLVVQTFSGFGEAANDDLIAHLKSLQADRRRAAFVALLWINKERIADRSDLKNFDLDAPDGDWQSLAKKWEVWWSTTKGAASSKRM